MKKSTTTRVYINLLCFPSEHLTGVGHFARRLFQMLDEGNTEGLSFELFYPAHLAVDRVFALPSSVDIRRHPVHGMRRLWRRILFEQLVLPFRCRDCDVFFSPVPAVPLLLRVFRKKTRIIPTIHDLIYVYVKGKYPFWRRQYIRWLNYFSAHAADTIVTVSENSRRDIIHFLGVAPEKVVVVYNFLPDAPIVDKESVFDPYFLYIGTLEPGKNIENMLRGFHQLLQLPAFSDYHFYLVGKEGWHYASIYRLCDDLGLSERVHFTGYVDSTEKAHLLRHTSALVLVSSYEGFGTPILEALYAHKPCVVSERSSLPEVLGKAGAYCQPDNIDSIARALQDVVEKRNDYLPFIPEQIHKFDPKIQIQHFLRSLSL